MLPLIFLLPSCQIIMRVYHKHLNAHLSAHLTENDMAAAIRPDSHTIDLQLPGLAGSMSNIGHEWSQNFPLQPTIGTARSRNTYPCDNVTRVIYETARFEATHQVFYIMYHPESAILHRLAMLSIGENPMIVVKRLNLCAVPDPPEVFIASLSPPNPVPRFQVLTQFT